MSAARRLNVLQSTLASPVVDESSILPSQTAASSKQSDDDVVIVAAVRTPIGKAKRGVFKDTHPTELLVAVLRALAQKIDPKLVQDVVVGQVLAPGGGATQARMAALVAGFPETTAVTSLNRQCSSGLQAVANVAAAIKSGFIDIGIGAGVESMSQHEMGPAAVGDLNPNFFEHEKARDCLMSMGQTSENVAERYGVTRQIQDEFSLDSQRKAAKALKEGRFDAEIVPITVTVKTADGQTKTITVTKDEGPRETKIEDLSKLKPAFKQNGTTTAGNSSQVSDGAAAVLLMRRSVARKLGLTPIGVFRSFAVVGVPPDVMGIGPKFAIPEAVKQAHLRLDDIDFFEINEAFASQASYCVRELGLPANKVNPHGGAIALGHPLGCTGARQVATLLNELKQYNKKTGVISMCIGTGMGAAAVIEREN